MENYLHSLNEIWGHDPKDHTKALQWIEKTVERAMEEGLYLDFKQKSEPGSSGLNDDDRANLAKAISGYANTDGGLIVWGVKAKANSKEDPDVAIELKPISRLKHFHTSLNAIAGGLGDPPVAGVENRAVPNGSGSDAGYVVTIIPPRRDTLVQAMARTCKGFFIRSGSGFHQLPEALIAEFYRRKRNPLLKLVLDAGEVQLEEKLLHAENYKKTHWRRENESPWGLCQFEQTVALPWIAKLRNEGVASARCVEFNLTCSPCSEWEICTIEREFKTIPTGNGYERATIPIPWPVSKFTSGEAAKGFGALTNPLHPGQEIVIGRGVLRIAATSQTEDILGFRVEVSAFADDSPPFRLLSEIAAEQIRPQIALILKEKVQARSRIIPEPEFHGIDN